VRRGGFSSAHIRLNRTLGCVGETSVFVDVGCGWCTANVSPQTKNLAFVSQFVELPLDVVFTVEYSVRAAQMAVYQLLGITRPIPPVTPHDKSLHTRFEALLKALK
jgi:oleate hydratase